MCSKGWKETHRSCKRGGTYKNVVKVLTLTETLHLEKKITERALKAKMYSSR